MLLFDEPTASLDELSEERIYKLVHELQRQRGFSGRGSRTIISIGPTKPASELRIA
jgi:ABC-type transporter Mla maintaining outer membrane lipid asymmetry ATPase subunit MlaF